MALGGTNYAGASCYYMQLADMHILLDCGKKISGSKAVSPDYQSLLQSGAVAALSQLDALLLSHGHFDHLGALPAFTRICRNTPVFATGLTKALGASLLFDKVNQNFHVPALRNIQDELAKSMALERIQTVSYGKTFSLGPLRVTFYNAGHVPGAAMIYFESSEFNVLYTGDFRMEDTMLTLGCHLPHHVKPDVLILCGLHAKHPGYREVNNLAVSVGELFYSLRRGESVSFIVQQLTKGVEAALFLQNNLPSAPLYIEPQVWQFAERLRQLNLAVWNASCRPFPSTLVNAEPGVFIASRKLWFCRAIKANFSLHASYDDCAAIIEQCSPSVVFLVHSPPDKFGTGDNALARQFPGIQIIQPEQGRLYGSSQA